MFETLRDRLATISRKPTTEQKSQLVSHWKIQEHDTPGGYFIYGLMPGDVLDVYADDNSVTRFTLHGVIGYADPTGRKPIIGATVERVDSLRNRVPIYNDQPSAEVHIHAGYLKITQQEGFMYESTQGRFDPQIFPPGTSNMILSRFVNHS